MATATHGYMAELSKTPGFFTAAIAAEGENPFDHSFRNHTETSAIFAETFGIHPHQDSQRDANNNNNNLFLQSMPEGQFTPLFGFSKSSEYPNPLFHTQAPSPPASATQSPPNWPYNEFQSQHPPRGSLHNITTQNYSQNPRIDYGQVTPPDDQSGVDFKHENYQAGYVPSPMNNNPMADAHDGGKRKRTSNAPVEDTPKSSKRSRKSTKSKLAGHASNVDLQSPEGEKRSKFLERNRVAASKCRQKKKEWTNNLEAKARELQNSKNQMAMMVTSLKEEVMWLKGEMLKHTGCGCVQIRDYLTKQADSITATGSMYQPFESAASPVGSAPNSRASSVSHDSVHRPSRDDSFDFEKPRTAPDSATPTAHFKSENELEALLTSQLAQDTSDKGISERVTHVND
ncbi:hypothetical protein MMC34_002238 [Xylographa carneopallida]|nr:hypothetical protein [Xylographa carneopallida]